MFKNAINIGTKNSLALLKDIKSVSSFYLAGGTALSLQMGHRISYDLDFFTQEVFDTDKLLKSLNEVFKLHDVILTDGSLRGFTDDCEISFFLYQYPLVNKKEVYDGIFLASIKDIALMKIIAIGSRGARKDFYDLYFILKNCYSITDLFDAF
ncbi:nucleotidyl transferase AbiEii/AbiGii toxin family protein, partial [Patescibacteria group bacterium]|nr:nucleotidyl transferase AbiEii/AbiGii toxin family protein [Patescibacteria group bacterium]